ncbi:hypothetical protein AB0H83_21275 [Dactylosporangium sp. NPDC050688]|uniref:hypothetical protein n=1 Tax=Dactylosporangium sp. NPDC050688 TaxID=3157217 RepID=UPI003403CD82
MPRTDVHRPPLVQERDPFNHRLFVEDHNHEGGVCTLDRHVAEGWFRGCCHLRYIGRANIYCGCRGCSGNYWRRRRNRRVR